MGNTSCSVRARSGRLGDFRGRYLARRIQSDLGMMVQRASDLERESRLLMRVVLLKFSGGLSEREIAVRLNRVDATITRRKIQVLLQRARELAREYDMDSDGGE